MGINQASKRARQLLQLSASTALRAGGTGEGAPGGLTVMLVPQPDESRTPTIRNLTIQSSIVLWSTLAAAL